MSTPKRRRRTAEAKPRPRSRVIARRDPEQARAILVIQFDSEQLERDGLDLTPFVGAASLAADVVLVRATTLDDLLQQLAGVHGCTFDVVATIGHSNARGIRIAPDQFIGWDAYAEYLKPFGPRRLAIVGCLAGQYPSTASVFAGLRTLRRIYAPPALANRTLASGMVLSLPYLLDHRIPDRDLLRFVQAGFALAGRQVWEWRRTDWERDKGNVLAPIRHELLRRASNELIAWLAGKRRA